MTERNANENQKEDETDCKMKVNASHETVLPQSVENKEPIKKHIRKIKKLTVSLFFEFVYIYLYTYFYTHLPPFTFKSTPPSMQ